MNTIDTTQTTTPNTSILVWDLPTRLFHWSLAICFAGAWLTSDSERQQLLHFLFGYSLFGLILFRLAWGLIGSRHARFSQFVRGPGAVMRYLRSLLGGHPEHSVGHNPAGAIAVLVLLALGLATAATGWMMASGRAGESLEEVHEVLATAMLAVVAVHILAVIVSSVLHKENLARAMVTGRKRGPAQEAIRRGFVPVAALMALALAAFWTYGIGQQRVPLGLGGGAGLEADEHARGAGAGADAEHREYEEDEEGEEDDD